MLELFGALIRILRRALRSAETLQRAGTGYAPGAPNSFLIQTQTSTYNSLSGASTLPYSNVRRAK